MTNDNDEQQVLILTRGVPSSGKSTWALSWVSENPGWRVRVNRDDLRMSALGSFTPGSTPEEKRHAEETVSTLEKSMVEAALKAKMSVVIDATNLTHRYAKEWLRLGKKLGVKTEFKDFDISLEEALSRNKKRGDEGGRFVPEDVIRSFYDRFVNKKTGKLKPYPVLDPTFEPVVRKYTRDLSKPTAVMVDIDGTVARMKDRSPFAWHLVGSDEPIEDVVDMVKIIGQAGIEIIFMSGRDEVCREETQKWLRETFRGSGPALFVSEFPLFMRPEKDFRGDAIVKHELFWENVGEKYDVLGVIDDRLSVSRMWNSIGLTLFRVGDPDADF